MEEETVENSTSSNSSMYYVLGAIVLVAVIGAGYMMRPKTVAPTPGEQQPATTAVVATPKVLGPISRLSCDTQYYNPIIGFAKYYISVDGSDVTGPTTVDCTTTVSQENKVIATEKATTTLSANATRGGQVFKCSTPGLDLKPSIPTKVEVVLKDDQGAKATCSAVFALPRP